MDTRVHLMSTGFLVRSLERLSGIIRFLDLLRRVHREPLLVCRLVLGLVLVRGMVEPLALLRGQVLVGCCCLFRESYNCHALLAPAILLREDLPCCVGEGFGSCE